MTGWSVSGDSITFIVDASNLGSEFTVGGTASSPTAVSLQSIHANSGINRLLVIIALLLLAALSGVVLRLNIKTCLLKQSISIGNN